MLCSICIALKQEETLLWIADNTNLLAGNKFTYKLAKTASVSEMGSCIGGGKNP